MDDTRQRIEDLIADCAHCIDDDRLEDWPAFFTEDARYVITTRESHAAGMPVGVMTCSSRAMLTDRVISLRDANIYEPHVYRHLLSAPRIRGQSDGGYDVETGFAVIRTMQEGDMALFAAGKILDHVVFEGDTPLFRSRIVVCDSHRIDTLIVIPI